MLQDENAKFEPPSESDYTPNGYQAKRFVEHGQRAKRGLCVDAQGPHWGRGVLTPRILLYYTEKGGDAPRHND